MPRGMQMQLSRPLQEECCCRRSDARTAHLPSFTHCELMSVTFKHTQPRAWDLTVRTITRAQIRMSLISL
jgi:hypothetical protein